MVKFSSSAAGLEPTVLLDTSLGFGGLDFGGLDFGGLDFGGLDFGGLAFGGLDLGDKPTLLTVPFAELTLLVLLAGLV